jgi:hypothetical protein
MKCNLCVLITLWKLCGQQVAGENKIHQFSVNEYGDVIPDLDALNEHLKPTDTGVFTPEDDLSISTALESELPRADIKETIGQENEESFIESLTTVTVQNHQALLTKKPISVLLIASTKEIELLRTFYNVDVEIKNGTDPAGNDRSCQFLFLSSNSPDCKALFHSNHPLRGWRTRRSIFDSNNSASSSPCRTDGYSPAPQMRVFHWRDPSLNILLPFTTVIQRRLPITLAYSIDMDWTGLGGDIFTPQEEQQAQLQLTPRDLHHLSLCLSSMDMAYIRSPEHISHHQLTSLSLSPLPPLYI